MYTTMPLSAYKRSHYASKMPTSDGSNSGCLLLQDDQEEESSCFINCRDLKITTLPFPQNTFLSIYPSGDDYSYTLFFVPVINQPIASNQYYIIKKHSGEVLRCARLEDQQSCCFFFTTIPDADPRPLDPEDIYQQFIITRSKTCQGYFNATCVALDGVVPKILRNNFKVRCAGILSSLDEAKGIDTTIRDHLPGMNFPLTCMQSEPIVVGKWYCPFMFIKDIPMKEQVKRSLFYEMTLERRWERIFTCRNCNGVDKRSVAMDVGVSTEGIRVGCEEAAHFEEDFVDGFVLFNGVSSNGDELPSVGLSSVMVKTMLREQERVGWVERDEKKVRMSRRVEYEGEALWLSFECFVLVERFVFKRMDGSLVLEYDCKHTHKVMDKWINKLA